MKLLIKVYWNDINPYDLIQILDVIKAKDLEKEDTKICIMTNDKTFDFSPYEYFYSSETNIPKMINMNLDELDWDIVLPIYKPTVVAGLDTVKIVYNKKYPNLDGVLLLTDSLPIIGRKYYEKFGYVYNPVYKYKNFDEEFMSVLKQTNKFISYDKSVFKILELKSEDDKIYEMRKKFNFNLI